MTWKPKTNINVQLNYVVAFQLGGIVKSNPKGALGLSMGQGDVEALYMTSAMNKVVQDAFKFAIVGQCLDRKTAWHCAFFV